MEASLFFFIFFLFFVLTWGFLSTAPGLGWAKADKKTKPTCEHLISTTVAEATEAKYQRPETQAAAGEQHRDRAVDIRRAPHSAPHSTPHFTSLSLYLPFLAFSDCRRMRSGSSSVADTNGPHVGH